MISILYSEIVKLKRSLVFFVIPIAAFVTALLSVFNATEWNSTFINNAVLWALLMGPAISSLFTGYVFSAEYHDKTINNLLVYPYAAYKFFIAKMFAIFSLIATSLIISYVFTLALGFAVNIPDLNMDIIAKSSQIYFSLIIMESAFMPIAALLAILSKNYILSTGVGIVTALIGGVFTSFQQGSLFPSTAATYVLYGIASRLGMLDHHFQLPLSSIVSLILYFAIPLIIGIVYFHKMDVHSGS